MKKILLFWLALTCLPAVGQTTTAIVFADQFPTTAIGDLVSSNTICPSPGCTIYATSPSASRSIGTLDPGSKAVTVYLGPFTYTVNTILLRASLRIIGMGGCAAVQNAACVNFDNGTTLQSSPSPSFPNTPVFQLPSDNHQESDVYLYGLHVLANPGNTAQGGLWLDASVQPGQSLPYNPGINHSTFEDLSFFGFQASAIALFGTTADVSGINQLLSFRNIEAYRPSGSSGPDLRIEGAAGQIDFIECHLDGPGQAGDQWANIYIGNLKGGPIYPYSLHFFNLTSQSANIAVQVGGGDSLSFIGSHHEALSGAYQLSVGSGLQIRRVWIANASFAGNVGRNGGVGFLVNASGATGVVLDAPLILGTAMSPSPDNIVNGSSASTVALLNPYSNTSGPLGSVILGNLFVNGTLSKSAGSFKIDHPLDPENKYLSHSFVESPDMMNIYNGVVTLDAKGKATVKLPDYFEALNRDFRYQLTCLGAFAPVFVAGEIRHNSFRIAGGRPGLKVSWQITGVRHDAYANEHRIQVEEEKPAEERGRLLNPAPLPVLRKE
jgi:hypothetical protein